MDSDVAQARRTFVRDQLLAASDDLTDTLEDRAWSEVQARVMCTVRLDALFFGFEQDGMAVCPHLRTTTPGVLVHVAGADPIELRCGPCAANQCQEAVSKGRGVCDICGRADLAGHINLVSVAEGALRPMWWSCDDCDVDAA